MSHEKCVILEPYPRNSVPRCTEHGTHLDLHAVTRPVHTRARNEGPRSFHNRGEGPPITWLLPVFRRLA